MSIVSLCLTHTVQTVLQNLGILFNCKLSSFYPVTMALSLCALYPALDKLYPFLSNTLHLSHMKLVLETWAKPF